ncbi:hypothetical protein CBR_g23113 [Chara braunii]|uniref:RRP15-like protein n=1 Tax=Chara braunii TaxID=69332 RepID=A0A388L3L0_CHABU|nr:hypothetical protein CBR_g23113 [Chara braunii]|eukprot:GBG76899.1 hypothetical protein CBR_g23113 [Chara braunii]
MARGDGGSRARMARGRKKKGNRSASSHFPAKIKRDLSVFDSDDGEEGEDRRGRQVPAAIAGRHVESGAQDHSWKVPIRGNELEDTVRSDDKELAADLSSTREADKTLVEGGNGVVITDKSKEADRGRRGGGRRVGGGRGGGRGGGGGWEQFFAGQSEEDNDGGVDEEKERKGGRDGGELGGDGGEESDGDGGEEEEEEGEGSGEEEEEEEDGTGRRSDDEDEAEDSDGDGDGDGTGEGGRTSRAGEAFAKAFESIVGGKSDLPLPGSSAATGAVPIPILARKKKRVVEKLRRQEEELKASVQAKRSKREVLAKGRVLPLTYLDVKEKQLLKIATRGVVKLFNAVSEARKVEEEDVDEKDAVKLKKAAFLSELRGTLMRGPSNGGQEDAKKMGGTVAVQMERRSGGEVSQPGWEVLKEDYMVRQSRLKDWDQVEEGNEIEAETLAFPDGEDSSSGDD